MEIPESLKYTDTHEWIADHGDGTVIESNPALEAQPDAVNNAPYGAGWLFKLKLADAADLNGLLGAAAYRTSAGVP